MGLDGVLADPGLLGVNGASEAFWLRPDVLLASARLAVERNGSLEGVS